MEGGSFHSQMLSVMELLAQAAVAEINRRVDDSCAVLRLEVSQSRRDIDVLKRKCEVMEAELRRTRIRVRRKGFYPSPVVKVVLNRERQDAGWDRRMEPETRTRQSVDTESVHEADVITIKEEDDVWKNDSQDKLAEHPPCFEATPPASTDVFVERFHSAEDPADPGSVVFPTDGYDTFPEQQINRTQNEAELLVKPEKEEGPDESGAPLDPGHTFVLEDEAAPLYSSGVDAGDASFPYTGQQYEQTPSGLASQSGTSLEDMEPQIPSAPKSHFLVVSAARAKRRARTFGFRRPQQDDAHNSLSPMNSLDQSSALPPAQPQFRDPAPHLRIPNEESNPSALSSSGHSRSSFALARRMRTPWWSGIREKRFGCTYCDKSFMRLSQLQEHLRCHTGEKPFSCTQCGRSFTKQCNLIRHAVVHSGEKPYECSLCGKCFTQRSSLKSHQKTAH